MGQSHFFLTKMKISIANPATGLQKTIEIDEDKRLLPFFDKRMSHEVPGDTLGDEFKGAVLKIAGGNDKQGFPMKQGVLVNHRVREASCAAIARAEGRARQVACQP